MPEPVVTVRPRRTPRPAATGVTGASSGLGRALVERLAADGPPGPLVGLDTARAPVTGVQWRRADVRDPLLATRLRGLRTVVHLAVAHDPALEPEQRRAVTVRGTAQLLDACRAAGVERVVLLSSTDVYAAEPGTAPPLPVDAPLRSASEGAVVDDLLEVERLADHAARTGLDVVVLRAAALVAGRLGPELDGGLLRSLAAPRLLAVRGVEPLWQLCHAEDLLDVLARAARGELSGVLDVACDGWLTQARVEQLSGRRRLELPASVVLSTAERLQRLHVTPASPHELDHLLGPVVVSGERLRAAGWTPAWTNEAALADHLAHRPPAVRRPAPYGAAGATVAVLGSAALVRRARRRRGR